MEQHEELLLKKIELWVPQLSFHGEGQKFVNENFLKPKKKNYGKKELWKAPQELILVVRVRLHLQLKM